MDEKILKELKKKLEEEEELLTRELSEISVKSPSNEDNWMAVPDGEEAGNMKEDGAHRQEILHDRSAITDNLEIRLRNVKGALKKMEDSTYGVCEETGEAIEIERLRVNPAARTCKKHKEKED